MSFQRRTINKGVMLTPQQLRAARAFIGWNRDQLAVRSGTSVKTIQDFEKGESDSKQGTVAAWRKALHAAGVTFIDADEHGGSGIRGRK